MSAKYGFVSFSVCLFWFCIERLKFLGAGRYFFCCSFSLGLSLGLSGLVSTWYSSYIWEVGV